MSADPPSTVGYTLQSACDLLAEAGCENVEVTRVGPSEERSQGRRTMVIRQRNLGGEGVELTVAPEWQTPISDD
ncbi:MAG: hypothetical protein ACOCX2_12755 [Armatimonadota bacterium]